MVCKSKMVAGELAGIKQIFENWGKFEGSVMVSQLSEEGEDSFSLEVPKRFLLAFPFNLLSQRVKMS